MFFGVIGSSFVDFLHTLHYVYILQNLNGELPLAKKRVSASARANTLTLFFRDNYFAR